jgi:hypothetical protein
MTDRGFGMAGFPNALNVRRLMYQPLIWPAVASDQAGGLSAPFDAEGLERLTDALIDGMRRDVELDRDFLGGQMLVDKAKAIELTGG